MKTKDKKDMKETIEKIKDLDEHDFTLVKTAITVLAERQKLERAKKERKSK